jgi:hypothetical protein
MFKTIVILLGFTLGLLSTPGQATTYYLDSVSGNDWHAGTAATAAFKTLQTAGSNLYHPGDQILLKAGSVWTGETLEITTSGEPGDPIIVGSYGTGRRPIVDGVTNPNVIYLKDAYNVVVDGLTLQNGGGSLVIVEGGSDNTVRNCTLINASTFPIHVKNSPRLRFLNNTYASTGTFALKGDVLRAESQVSGITISGNTFTLNYASRVSAGIYILDVDNAVISGNRLSGGSQGIGIKGYTRNVTGAQIYGNIVAGIDNSGGGDGEAIELTGVDAGPWTVSGVVRNNNVYGGPYTKNAISAYRGTNIAAYFNFVKGPLLNAAFHWSTYSTGGDIHNNTIKGDAAKQIVVPHPFVVSSNSSANIYNNTIIK